MHLRYGFDRSIEAGCSDRILKYSGYFLFVKWPWRALLDISEIDIILDRGDHGRRQWRLNIWP